MHELNGMENIDDIDDVDEMDDMDDIGCFGGVSASVSVSCCWLYLQYTH